MPDQFGHIGQMPQILRQGGLERAVVWRGVPEEIDRDAFWWEAPDGSARAHRVHGVRLLQRRAPSTRRRTPAELAEADRRVDRASRPFMASDRMLVMVGYDHAGPDATLPERLAAAQDRARRASTPSIGGDRRPHRRPAARRRAAGLARRAAVVRARAPAPERLLGARAPEARARPGRGADRTVRGAARRAGRRASTWPAEELDRAWTLLLWNGAHDSACGCSHDQVALDVDARFAEARAIGERHRPGRAHGARPSGRARRA